MLFPVLWICISFNEGPDADPAFNLNADPGLQTSADPDTGQTLCHKKLNL